MDEAEPLPDEVLATMEATARAYVTAHPDSGDVVRVGWDHLYSLITEVRRLRAERVRWEALRIPYTRYLEADKGLKGPQAYGALGVWHREVRSVLDAVADVLATTPPDQQAAGPEQPATQPSPRTAHGPVSDGGAVCCCPIWCIDNGTLLAYYYECEGRVAPEETREQERCTRSGTGSIGRYGRTARPGS